MTVSPKNGKAQMAAVLSGSVSLLHLSNRQVPILSFRYLDFELIVIASILST